MGPAGRSIQSRLTTLLQNIDRSTVKEGDLDGPVVQSLLQTRAVTDDSPLTTGKYSQLKNSDYVRTAKRSIQDELNKGPYRDKITDIQGSIDRKQVTAEALNKKLCLRMFIVNSKLYDLQLEIDLLISLGAPQAEIDNKQITLDALNKAFSTFLEETESILETDDKTKIYNKLFSDNKGLIKIDEIGHGVQGAWKNITDDGIKGRLNEAVFVATADIARRATDLKENALSRYFDTLEVDPMAGFNDFETFFNIAARAPEHLLVMDEGRGRAMSATGEGGQVVGSMTSRDVSINTGTQNAAITGTGNVFHGPVNIYTQGATSTEQPSQAVAAGSVGAVGGVDPSTAGKVSKEQLLADMIAATGDPNITSSEALLELIEEEFVGNDFLSTSDKVAAAEKLANKLLTVEGDRAKFIAAYTDLMSSTGPSSFNSALSSLNHLLSSHFISERASIERMISLIDENSQSAQDLLTTCLEGTGLTTAELKTILETHLSGLLDSSIPASFVTNNQAKLSGLLAKLNRNDQSDEAKLLKLTLNNLYDSINDLDPSSLNAAALLSWCEEQLYILGLDSFQELEELTTKVSDIANPFDVDDALAQKAKDIIDSRRLTVFTELNTSDYFLGQTLETISNNISHNANAKNQLTALFTLVSNLSQVHGFTSVGVRVAITAQVNQTLEALGLTPQEFYNICCMNRFFDLDDPTSRAPINDLYTSLPDRVIAGQNVHADLAELRELVESIFEDTPNPINTKQGSSAYARFDDLIDAAKAGSKGSTDDLANGIKNMLKVIKGKTDDTAFLQNFPTGHVGIHHFAEKFHYDVKNEHRGTVHFEPRNVSNAMQNFMRIANLPQNQQIIETNNLRDFIEDNLANYPIPPAFFESDEARAPLSEDEKAQLILDSLTNTVYPSLNKMSPQNVQAGRYSDYLLGTNLASLTPREAGVAKRVFNLDQLPSQISDSLLTILTDFTDGMYVNNDPDTKACLDEFYFDLNTRPKDGQDGKDGKGISLSDLNARIKAAIDAKGAEIDSRFRDLEADMEASLDSIRNDIDQLKANVQDQGQDLLRLNDLISARENELDRLIFNANAKDLAKERLAANLDNFIQAATSSQPLQRAATLALASVDNKGDYLTLEEMAAFNDRLEAATSDGDRLTIIDDLTNDLDQRSGAIPSTRLQIEALSDELNSLRQAQTDTKTKMEANAQKLIEHGALINENRSGIAALDSIGGRVDGLEAQTADLTSKVDALSSDVHNLNQEMQDIASRVAGLEATLDNLNTGLTDQIRGALSGMLSDPQMRNLIQDMLKDMISSGSIGDIPNDWMNSINQLLAMHPALEIVTKLDALMVDWFIPDADIAAPTEVQRRTYAAEALDRLIQLFPELNAIVPSALDLDGTSQPQGPAPQGGIPRSPSPQSVEIDYRLRNWSDLDMAPADAKFEVHKDLLTSMNLLSDMEAEYAASQDKANFTVSTIKRSNLTRGGFFALPHLVRLKPDVKAQRERIRQHNQTIIDQLATGVTPQTVLQEYPELTPADYIELALGEEPEPNNLNDYAIDWRNIQTYAHGAENEKDLVKDLKFRLDKGIDPFLVSNLPTVEFVKTESLDEPIALPKGKKKQKYKTVTTATVKADVLKQLREMNISATPSSEKVNYVISGAVANTPLLERWAHAFTPTGTVTDTDDPLAPFASEFLLLLESNFDPSKNLMPIGGTAFASPWSWALLRDVARAGVQGPGTAVSPYKSFAQLMNAFNNISINERNDFIANHKALADTRGISVYQLFDMNEINRQRFPLSANQARMMNDIVDKTKNT